MKLDELLNKLLDIANTRGNASNITVQVSFYEERDRRELTKAIQDVKYVSPDNKLKSPNNSPQINLET